ncbi:MAG TPA: peptide chain release factor N(5)-glutamine methyltransferase [Crocinitomicaceae bacterium]|nr:peptide chain release factor N(5)-glutamine methyltransferase [Crocinitomicaceae bacterium]
MTCIKNDLEAVKSFFKEKIPGYSSSEINIMVKFLTIKRLNINESDYLIQQPFLFSESDLLFFRDAVKRMQKNEPFQHVLGEVEFYGLLLNSDKRALIPRPETEELVDWIVNSFDRTEELKIADLCSGSGCIALVLKSIFVESEVNAIELSEDAIELIQENCKKTELQLIIDEADVLAEDAFSQFQKNSFDCWVSNPPYIPNKDKETMHENVLDFEPDMALFVEDDDVLIFYERITKQANLFLKPNGLLFFEIHEDLAEETVSILKSHNFVNIELRKDLQGKDRMIKAQKLSSQNESE